MSKKYDTLVYIGRFQPIHNAHLEIMRRALLEAKRLIVIVGSADQPRTHKNPFTFEERKELIVQCTASKSDAELIVVPNVDTIYDDDAWIIRVQDIVYDNTPAGEDKIAIIGSKKDKDTEAYLNMFPQWDFYDVPHQEILNASDIRNMYFSDINNLGYLVGVVPTAAWLFLQQFSKTDTYTSICEEKRHIDKYVKAKEVYPYPIIAVTVDSVVIQSGHILLIKRKHIPGRGLWALPGGYFDAVKDKTPLDGIIRELKEETRIDVPEKVLRGSLLKIKEFCAPGRSLLGRSITFAGHFRLTDGEWKLPKVIGDDDAEKAQWIPLSEVKKNMLFDDHYDIIQYFVPSIRSLQ